MRKLAKRIYPDKFSLIVLGFVVLYLLPCQSSAHEPVFGLGPETIYKGGLGLEVEYESEWLKRASSEHTWQTELIYGLTDLISLTASLPALKGGVGDITLRGKWRFWTESKLGVQNKLAVVGGITLPTGTRAHGRGNGATDYLLALAAGHESIRWYYFGDIRWKINEESFGVKRGNKTILDLSWGLRPIPPSYYRIDPVLLVEFSANNQARTEINGIPDPNSGGTCLWLGPTALISYRNLMFKAGVRFPVLQNLNGTREKIDREAVMALEYHF